MLSSVALFCCFREVLECSVVSVVQRSFYLNSSRRAKAIFLPLFISEIIPELRHEKVNVDCLPTSMKSLFSPVALDWLKCKSCLHLFLCGRDVTG